MISSGVSLSSGAEGCTKTGQVGWLRLSGGVVSVARAVPLELGCSSEGEAIA